MITYSHYLSRIFISSYPPTLLGTIIAAFCLTVRCGCKSKVLHWVGMEFAGEFYKREEQIQPVAKIKANK